MMKYLILCWWVNTGIVVAFPSLMDSNIASVQTAQ